MALIRQKRVKNKTVFKFLTARDGFQEAKIALDIVYAELMREAKKVFNIFVPLKNSVSDKSWSGKQISKLKVIRGGKYIELTLTYNIENSKESFWEFPVWMIGADADRITAGIQEMLHEQGLRYQAAEHSLQTED
jgi:hypothetical protein